jgi:hypothetical protein
MLNFIPQHRRRGTQEFSVHDAGFDTDLVDQMPGVGVNYYLGEIREGAR